MCDHQTKQNKTETQLENESKNRQIMQISPHWATFKRKEKYTPPSSALTEGGGGWENWM